jgi:hypothetical protein
MKIFSGLRLYNLEWRCGKWIIKDVKVSGGGLILRYYPSIRLEGLRNAKKNLRQDSRSLSRDLNSGPPEYEEELWSFIHNTIITKQRVSRQQRTKKIFHCTALCNCLEYVRLTHNVCNTGIWYYDVWYKFTLSFRWKCWLLILGHEEVDRRFRCTYCSTPWWWKDTSETSVYFCQITRLYTLEEFHAWTEFFSHLKILNSISNKNLIYRYV